LINLPVENALFLIKEHLDSFIHRYNMKAVQLFTWLFLILLNVATAQTQSEKPAVTFEGLYDEPYSINKLFIGFQPLYGELFATNPNAGFGVEASYYYKDKFDLKGNFRKTYSSEFFDYNREASIKNSNVTNSPQVFNYLELGGTYHFKDFDQDSKTTMVLYKKSFKGDRWAAMVPLHAEIPCKVRKIYGARLGVISWKATTDINRALSKQGLTNANLLSSSGKQLPETYLDQYGQQKQLNVFSNIQSLDIYLGGSMTWMRNVAVSFDNYEGGVDDGLMTLFFDIMIAPSLSLDPIMYGGEKYSTNALKTRPIGLRAGIDGKFNRTFGWSYGGEVGYRPSLAGQGFYAMFKIAFPLYGTNLDNKVESFGK
jgi:hypothetical protein